MSIAKSSTTGRCLALVLATSVLASLAVASSAAAQGRELEAAEDSASTVSVELTTYWDSEQGASVVSLTPLVRLWHPIGAGGLFSAEWGFSYISLSPSMGSSEGAFRVANPFLAFHHASYAPNLRWRIGGGLVLPVASIPDQDGAKAEAAYLTSALAYSGWDLWLWMPETLSLVVPFRLEGDVSEGLVLALDAGLGLLVPVGDNNADVELDVQVAGEIAGRIGEVVRLGARFQLFWLPTSDGFLSEDDSVLISLVPFFRAQMGRGFLGVRATINLDEKEGLWFEDSRIWGLHLNGGAEF